MILKAYKYRLKPTEEQIKKLNQSIGVCRLVYNLALETKIEAFRKGVKLSAYDLCYQLVDLKKEYSWIKEVDSQALQASVKKVDVAFRNFFKGAGYPKFKSKKSVQSFQCPHEVRRVDWNRNTLTIPKIKDIPIILTRQFEGNIKTITISKTSTGKYFASILVEVPESIPSKPPVQESTAIGIDLGIKDLLITSEGIKVINPHFLRNDLVRLQVLNRRASRKRKGSKNKRKAYLKVARLHERITNKRMDTLHKLSYRLTHDNQVETICMENLAVSNLIQNHKLAQAISDVSWGKFKELLKYKSEWYGKNLIVIGRYEPSSKKCSTCGTINNSLTLKDREWRCNVCHSTHDRDINAAKNIKLMGLSGEPLSIGPVEPPAIAGASKQETLIHSVL